MSLVYVCIEVRKNICCANVFLQFDQSLTETEFLKINVDEDAIRLRELSTETKADVGAYFNIEVRTMSNLTVEEVNASFRLSICNIKEEAFPATTLATATTTIIPKLMEGSTAALHCSNCESVLSERRCYERIREFPTGAIDLSEFFCHHGPDFGTVLVPQITDLFYGFQFVVLNTNALQAATKIKDTHLYCRRCLQFLGETQSNGAAAKLWSDTVRFKHTNCEQLTDIFEPSMSTPIAQLFQRILHDVTLATSQLQFAKVLLEASFPSRQRKFMLLHILEQQLFVLRNRESLAHGSHNNNNVLHVKLSAEKCSKLLYRLMDSDDSTQRTDAVGNVPALLAYWQQDIAVQTFRISPSLFSMLLQQLEENSLLLPEIYRHARDDFQLSYVFYENKQQ